MKKTLIILVVLGLFVAGVSGLQAKAEEGKAALKVALVDFQRAINETEAGKNAEKALNAAMEERKKKFDILKKEFDSLRQDYEKQQLVLSGKPLEEKRNKLQQKLVDVEKTGASYEQELAKQKAESLQKIVADLQGVVKEIGSAESYDFIFERTQGGVLFTSSAEDITDRVIKQYNKTYKK